MADHSGISRVNGEDSTRADLTNRPADLTNRPNPKHGNGATLRTSANGESSRKDDAAPIDDDPLQCEETPRPVLNGEPGLREAATDPRTSIGIAVKHNRLLIEASGDPRLKDAVFRVRMPKRERGKRQEAFTIVDDSATEEAAEWTESGGMEQDAYLTLNPQRPVGTGTKGETLAIGMFNLDFDPIGNAPRETVFKAAAAVQDHLAEEEFGRSWMTITGRGYHLIYPLAEFVDPVEGEAVIKALVQAIAVKTNLEANHPRVHLDCLDPVTCETRIPGTINTKPGITNDHDRVVRIVDPKSAQVVGEVPTALATVQAYVNRVQAEAPAPNSALERNPSIEANGTAEHGGATNGKVKRRSREDNGGAAESRSIVLPPPIDRSAEYRRDDGADLPFIEVRPHHVHPVNECIDALAYEKSLYQYGAVLVYVPSREEEEAAIERVREAREKSRAKRRGFDRIRLTMMLATKERIELSLSKCATFYRWKETKRGVRQEVIPPPESYAKFILHWGEWPTIPRLRAALNAPTVTEDGRIIEGGYDEESELFIRSDGLQLPKIPEAPTKEDAIESGRVLTDLFCDFPFDNRPVDEAACLAYILTLTCRFTFRGPAPLFLVDASSPGSGKSLVVDVGQIIATGKKTSVCSAHTDDNEMRKFITSCVVNGDLSIAMDNTDDRKPFGTPALDRALTSEWWKDRILGGSTTQEVQMYAVFSATGNQVEYRGDIGRRVCKIRITPEEETPEYRTGFKHGQLDEYVARNRPNLLAHALTIMKAYILAGKPLDATLKEGDVGSYVAWSKTIRNAIRWLGLADPMARAIAERKASPELEKKKALVEAIADFAKEWAHRDGFTVAEILAQAKSDDGRPGAESTPLVNALMPYGRDGKLPNGNDLASTFRGLRDRPIGGRKLEPVWSNEEETKEKTRNGSKVWCLRDLNG